MKSESSYQKLQNEDTLSTISFQPPPASVKKQFDKKFGKNILLIAIITISTLLILCHLLVGYHIIGIHSNDERDEYWTRFYTSGNVPMIQQSACPILADTVDSHEYEDSISIMMHRKLTRDNLPAGFEKSPAMKMVKYAYETCRTGIEDLAPLDEMIKSVESSIMQNETMEDIADTVAALQSNFGVDTFFKFQVLANFQEPDGKIPYAIYVSPNTELVNIPDAEFLAKKVLNLRPSRVNDIDFEFLLILRDIVSVSKVENSSKWQIFDLKDFKMTENDFDFKTYVKSLTLDMSGMDLDSVKVVVTHPAYVRKIVELIKQTKKSVIKNFILKTLKMSILADFDDCMQVLEKYVPHAATVIYLSIMNSTEVDATRQKLCKRFEKSVVEIESIVEKYLSNDLQKKFVKEKLQKVGLSAEEPDWMQLNDKVARFDLAHKNLQIVEHNSGLVSILRMRRFAFGNAIAHLNDKTEALRRTAFENVAESKTKMEYSRIGNWIHIPVASFMDIDEQRIVLKMTQQIAKIVSSENFKWSPYGTQRPNMPFCKKLYIPTNILGQEQCFRFHGIDETDFSAVVGLEAAYRVLLKESNNPFAQHNLALELAKNMASDGSESKIMIAAGFLRHNNATNQCPQTNILPCFL